VPHNLPLYEAGSIAKRGVARDPVGDPPQETLASHALQCLVALARHTHTLPPREGAAAAAVCATLPPAVCLALHSATLQGSPPRS